MCPSCIQKAWVAMLNLCSTGVISYVVQLGRRAMGLEFVRITSVWEAQHVARKSPLTTLQSRIGNTSALLQNLLDIYSQHR